MTQWTSPQDIRDRWVGSDAPSDDDLLTALILDAEAVIVSTFPRIQERIDDELLSESVVTMVTSRMVSRLIRNPENLSYWQQNTGPFGQGRTFGNDKDIWLTQDERLMLAPQNSGKAFSFNSAPDMRAPSPDLDLLLETDLDPLWRSY